MTVTVPGYSTVTGRPEVILNLISEVISVPDTESTEQAECLLRSLAEENIIEIKEESTWQ